MTEQMGQRIYVIPLHYPCNFSVRAELFQSEKKFLMQIPVLHSPLPGEPNSLDLWKDPGICISSKLPRGFWHAGSLTVSLSLQKAGGLLSQSEGRGTAPPVFTFLSPPVPGNNQGATNGGFCKPTAWEVPPDFCQEQSLLRASSPLIIT